MNVSLKRIRALVHCLGPALWLWSAGAHAQSESKPQPAPAVRPVKVLVTVVPAALRFGTTRFDVRVGTPVVLTLKNTCVMPHNLLIVAPGEADTVIAQAMAMGQEAFSKDFIPNTPEVLASARLAAPGVSTTVEFDAPQEPGEYPYVCTFPGHGTVMRGIMRVRGEGEPLEAAITEQFKGPTAVDALARSGVNSHPMGTRETPLVVRSFVPNPGLDPAVLSNHGHGLPALRYNPETGRDEPKGKPIDPVPGLPAGIAVSFGPEFAYVWDATECRLMYAWTGGFLDMTPYWGSGTGGGRKSFDHVPTLEGTLVFKAAGPLPIGGKPVAKPVFKGYRMLNGSPEFTYQVAGMVVHEQILPNKDGFLLHCRIDQPPEPVRLSFDASVRDQIRCDQGAWEANTLVIPADHGDYFILNVAFTPGATIKPAIPAPVAERPPSEEP